MDDSRFAITLGMAVILVGAIMLGFGLITRPSGRVSGRPGGVRPDTTVSIAVDTGEAGLSAITRALAADDRFAEIRVEYAGMSGVYGLFGEVDTADAKLAARDAAIIALTWDTPPPFIRAVVLNYIKSREPDSMWGDNPEWNAFKSQFGGHGTQSAVVK